MKSQHRQLSRQWFNWKVLSLFAIFAISVIPHLGIQFAKLIYEDLQFIPYSKIISAEECVRETAAKCTKAILYQPVQVRANQRALPGFATSVFHVRCYHSKGAGELTPVLLHESNAFFTDELNQCNEGVLAYFVEEDPVTSSWIHSDMVIGSEKSLMILSRSIRFLRSEFRTVIAATVPFQVILTTFIMMLLGGISRHRYFYTFITVSVMAFLNGAVFERLFFLRGNLISPMVKEFLSFFLLLIVCKETYTEKFKSVSKKMLLALSAAMIGLVHGLEISTDIEWTMVLVCWVALAAFKRFEFLTSSFAVFTFFYLISVITPFSLAPQYALSLFFMIYFTGFQIEQVRIQLLNSRLNQMGRLANSLSDVKSLIKIISKVHGVEKTTLSLVKSEHFEHWVFTPESQRPVKFITQDDSKVVSQVFASQKPLIHVEASQSTSKYRSSFFSAYPIHLNGEVFAVVSFTEYTHSFLHPDVVNHVGEMLTECSEIVSKALSQVSHRFSIEVEESFLSSIESEKEMTFEKQIQKTLNQLFEEHGISGYFGEMKIDQSIDVLASSGTIFDEKTNTGIHHEFDPVTLAFKRNEPIVLQSWKPLAEHLSQEEMNFYRKTATNSILSVPLIFSAGRVQFRFLLWLQTNESRSFTHDFMKVGRTIRMKLTQLIARQVTAVFDETVFSNVDSEVIKNVVHGRKSSVQENGELLMVDLARSTYFSQNLDVEDFSELKKIYQNIVTDHLAFFEYKLQMVIGDALLFTRSSSLFKIDRKQLIQTIYECDSNLKEYYSSHVSFWSDSGEPSLRVCSVFGDISRDLVTGSGGGWTIIGSAMSEVHKLEAVAKKFRNGIYFELDQFKDASGLSFQLTHVRPWNNGPRLRFVEYEVMSMRKAA